MGIQSNGGPLLGIILTTHDQIGDGLHARTLHLISRHRMVRGRHVKSRQQLSRAHCMWRVVTRWGVSGYFYQFL